jgi:glutamate 5-kinase
MRIVVKIGSNVLSRRGGGVDITRMSHLVDQVAELRRRGVEVILVSSGAVAAGRALLATDKQLDSVEQRQLFSAIGQAKLINHYYDLFREYGLHVGQVLTMKENFATRREYLNQRACMQLMLANGVIPIVNENDTVSVTELMFTDNDELSGLIASMLDVDELIILSNIDGIYTGAPSDPHAQVLREVTADCNPSDYIRSEHSSLGRGGMTTKCTIARKVADEGIRVVIANGLRDRILLDLFDAPQQTPHTLFTPRANATSTVKKWIAHSESFAKGVIRINDRAAQVLCSDRAVSLLPIGVTAIEGEFEEGDIVTIVAPDNRRIAVGRTAFASDYARNIIGKHDCKPIVHYDYLAML